VLTCPPTAAELEQQKFLAQPAEEVSELETRASLIHALLNHNDLLRSVDRHCRS
jgi:hypothetical protein